MRPLTSTARLGPDVTAPLTCGGGRRVGSQVGQAAWGGARHCRCQAPASTAEPGSWVLCQWPSKQRPGTMGRPASWPSASAGSGGGGRAHQLRDRLAFQAAGHPRAHRQPCTSAGPRPGCGREARERWVSRERTGWPRQLASQPHERCLTWATSQDRWGGRPRHCRAAGHGPSSSCFLEGLWGWRRLWQVI